MEEEMNTVIGTGTFAGDGRGSVLLRFGVSPISVRHDDGVGDRESTMS